MSETQFENLKLWLSSKFDDNDKGHKRIEDHLKKLNGSVGENTEHRLKTQGGWSVVKFFLGFLGAGNIVILIKLFLG